MSGPGRTIEHCNVYCSPHATHTSLHKHQSANIFSKRNDAKIIYIMISIMMSSSCWTCQISGVSSNNGEDTFQAFDELMCDL